MMTKVFSLAFMCITMIASEAQTMWRGELRREDGNIVVFNFELQYVKQKPVIYLVNAKDHFTVDKIRLTKDSVSIQMPVFESQLKAKVISAKKWEGVWIKGGSVIDQVMPFTAEVSNQRFISYQKPHTDISGRWAVTFTRPNGTTRPAIAEFEQRDEQLTGTFLTPSGDYRYLSGAVIGDSLRLSTFDGSHAFLFTALINNDKIITAGNFYSGIAPVETFTAQKNPTAVLPDIAAMYLKDGGERLNFRFPGLNKKMISITDERFKNKVVVIQIMGSWCPNCMDETAFLSEFYRTNKQRGIEVVALAYELSEDFNRSKASIEKFKNRFNVQYPILVTGVTVDDSLRTEKTLPQLTPIKAFPTTIFIDKHGKVAKIGTGFYGPGTGEHYIAFKKEFEETIDKLLRE